MKPIEYLSPYLPHDVKMIWKRPDDGKPIIQVLTISDYEFLVKRHHAKLILRPHSDLTKEIEHNKEWFTPTDILLEHTIEVIEKGTYTERDVIAMIPYADIQLLISWGFDVFGLHEKGLCVYYNELN